MRSVRLLAQARCEIRDAAEYYEDRVEGLGIDFTHKVDEALLDVCENPERWLVLKKDIRRRLIPRFPYCLLYRVEREEIVVVAVMHFSRQPGYWVGRGRK